VKLNHYPNLKFQISDNTRFKIFHDGKI